MEEKYVALSIPFFLIAMGIEALVLRRAGSGSSERREGRYRFADSVTNMACGIGQQVLEPFLRAAGLWAYVVLYDRARLFTVPSSAAAGWALLVVGVDLSYYVFHRASHRVNLLWASHVVHHQSEEYNLSVALRQSWIEILAGWVFYLPLALLGFSPAAFVAVSTIDTLYQFWIHTRAIRRLPAPIEWLFNTPSHHRVHHGVDPKYVDRNYAGIFIVWDRLFDTFQAEEEEPTYGTVKPLASWNALWANLHYWREMAALSFAAPRARDKAWAWLAPPSWRPKELSEGLGYAVVPKVTGARAKYDPRCTPGLTTYVGAQLALATAALAAMLWYAAEVPRPLLGVGAALILVEVVAWGALLEAKGWGTRLALLRVTATGAVLAWLALARGGGGVVAGLLVAIALAGSIATGVWLVRVRAGAEGALTGA